MAVKRSFHVLGGLVALGVLNACASTPPAPNLPPVISIVGKTCADKPALTGAISLMPKRNAPTNSVITEVGPSSSCVTTDGKSSNYVVYELPASPENHTITVGGQKEVFRAFAPKVTVLDANGGVVRAFEKDRIAYFGTTYSVQFRPQAGARYVLVQSEPDLVGTVMSAFETNLVSSQNYAYNPYGYGGSYTTQSGQERATTRSFSHEGKVVFYIQAVSGKIGLPETN